MKKKEQIRKQVKAGEIWSINDGKTRGHKSRITKNKTDVVEHIPITHSPETRRMKNIPLQENPNPQDDRRSYVLPKIQVSQKKYLGRNHPELRIINPTDKSVLRYIKKKGK